MTRLPFRILVFVVTTCAAPAWAQTPAPAQTLTRLTLQQAEQEALANHPQVHAATDLAAAAAAQSTEARAAYYPFAFGSLTGVDAESNSRIAAGGLNNPVIYDRYANGVTVNQLVTDFGRTGALVRSADLRGQSQQAVVDVSRAEALLRVDQAYYRALGAQAIQRVAEETVSARQLVVDQITALAKNQIKSDLDVSFAAVDLSQAQLLLLQAQNDVQAAFASLSAALGEPGDRTFELVEEPPATAPPGDVAAFTADALSRRPDLKAARLNVTAARALADAQGDLWRPTVSFTATTGVIPYRQSTLSDRYAAAGVNVNVPLFNGHLFGALKSEAQARAQAEDDRVRDLENVIRRDVRMAWLAASAAYQRLSLTAQLLDRATQARNLARSRYDLGLSSIVELSQAQLNLTQAELAQANARYDYAAQLSALNYQAGRRP